MSFLFKSPKPPPVEKIEPSDDARELRRRIAARGGFQSTILAGRSMLAKTNVFKRNLGGTRGTQK